MIQRVLLFVLVFTAAFCLPPVILQVTAADFIVNWDFEKGQNGWQLTSGKGQKGGRIIEETDKNHVLCAEGDTYWLGSTDYQIVSRVQAEHFAGKQLRVTFRAKGDHDAYPGVITTYSRGGKSEYLTNYWKTKYTESNSRPDDKFRDYEITSEIPQGTNAILGLSLYNVTHRGRLCFDDIQLSFVEPLRQTANSMPDISAPDIWQSLQFTDKELIQLGNTHNYLVTQAAYLYGRMSEVERGIYYVSQAGSGEPSREREKQAVALSAEITRLRGRLKALEVFYNQRFKKVFGSTYTEEKPWGFYWHDKGAGRDLLIAAGPARSDKPPFVELESSFERVAISADVLLKDLQQQAGGVFTSPTPNAAPVPAGVLFDNGNSYFPRQIVMGVRMAPYGFHSARFLNADFIFTHNLRQWTFDEQGNLKNDPTQQAAEIEHYDLRWLLTSWMDPKVRLIDYPPSFRESLSRDPELSAHTERGPVNLASDARFHPVNIFSPLIQKNAARHYEELGRLYHDDKRVVMVEYSGEPSPSAMFDGKMYVFEYSEEAKGLFRDGLRSKFKDIKILNRGWGVAYDSFDQIDLPSYKMLADMSPGDLPLISEFRRFMKLEYARHEQRIYNAYRKGDPQGHPVANRLGRSYLNGTGMDPFDTYRLAQTTDIFCTHDSAEGTARHRAELNYAHSIADYLGKPRGSLEFLVLNPEARQFDPERDDGLTLIRRGINSLWRLLMWDVTTISPWMQGRTERGFLSPTRKSAMTLIHESAGVLPLVRRQAGGAVEKALLNSRVVRPSTAILAPYDAPMVGWPDGQVGAEGVAIHRFLDEKNYDYTYIPEELILSGKETLADIKVLFTPYVLWASGPLQKKLLDWVEKGGVIISVGPLGYWDEYGRPGRALINKVFGAIPIEIKRAGRYLTEFPYTALVNFRQVRVETQVPYIKDTQPNLISASLGRGKVYLTADTSMDDVLSGSKAVILQAVDQAIGRRTAWGDSHAFELVMRQQKNGSERYLFVLNRSIDKVSIDTITVPGEYKDVSDMVVAGGFPLRAMARDGVTVFNVRLGPGEAACIRLGSFRPEEHK
ncbi:MAG: beta-galactosidase [Nitrospirae bacterium]|nr:beta-galactosidase [Nitrospirota bacterium]